MQLINRCLIPERTFKAYRHLLGCNEFLSPQNKYSNSKFLTSNEDCNQFRCYSGSSPPGVEKRRLPPLMSFPEIVWPSAIKTIRNWIFSNMIVTPHLDNDFNMRDFVEGAKQAVEVISAALKEGDFVALKELVAPEAYDELHASVSKLNVAEREHLQVIRDDIYFTFPYQVGVMFEDNEKRWVEITMVFHVLMGLKNMKNQGEDPPITLGLQPEYQEKLYILNYRFQREYTKGVENSSWIVNVVNHFKLADKARQ